MRIYTLTRQKNWSAQGQFGELTSDSGRSWKTGELPWKDNKPDISCIPEGEYPGSWQFSSKHNCYLYHFTGIEGRSVIEMHSANFMGDTAEGYISQLLGCVAPGWKIDTFKAGSVYAKDHPPLSKDQLGITSSRDALEEIHKDLQNADGSQPSFTLKIIRGNT